jgi:hypothetical protein
MLAVACTGSPSTTPTTEPSASQPPPQLSGKMIGALPLSNFTEAAIVDLDTGEVTDVEGEDIGNDTFLGAAAWGSDGNAYMAVDRLVRRTDQFGGGDYATQLLRVAPDGTATPIGPEIPDTGGMIGERDGVVYALTCGRDPGVVALDVRAPDEWRTVAEGCPAALSPDGAEVVTVVRDDRGSRVVITSLDDGSTRDAVRLEDFPELRTQAGLDRAPVELLSWGDEGIAVVVGQEAEGSDRYALVFLSDGGEPVVHALGSAVTYGAAWQPGGPLLALQQCLQCTRAFRRDPSGEVRAYDAAADTFIQLGSSDTEFGPVTWSPDGSRLLATLGQGDVLVLDAAGNPLGRLELPIEPLAWTA